MSMLKHKKATNLSTTLLPSLSWFSVRALEGYQTASKLFDDGRLNKSDFVQMESQDAKINCWRCGGDIHHPSNDGWCMTYKPKSKFNDHWECRGSKLEECENKVLCVACEAVSHASYHPNFRLNALYTKDTAYQLTLDEDLISFLIDPPAPPFLFCMAEANSQHVCWLSQYTLDNRLLSVTKGRRTALVNREATWNLAEKFKQLIDSANKIRAIDGAISLSTPLMSSRMDINGMNASNLQLSTSIHSAARHKETDATEVAELKKALQESIKDVEEQPYCYLTWYIATMYLKALLTDFEVKPISDWQQIKPPKKK